MRTLLITAALLTSGVSAPHISVYYYPWYNENFWLDYGDPSYIRSPLMLNQIPMLGHYNNSRENDAILQHLEWSTNFGIDNWICEWAPNTYHHTAVRDHVMPTLEGSNVTFAIFYGIDRIFTGPNSDWIVEQEESDLIYAHIQIMSETFFSSSNYWKIKGKPVVVVYLSRKLKGDWVAALDRVRTDFNVYLVGDEFHMGKPVPEHIQHWDAITTYNTHGLSKHEGYAEETGYVEDLRTVLQNQRDAADALGVDFIGNVIAGYNDRGVRLEVDRTVHSRQAHPDSSHVSNLSQSLQMALTVTDPDLEAVAICSWNEWMEDSQIEPSIVTEATADDGRGQVYTKGYAYKGYGADYLEVILSMAGRNADAAPALTLTSPAVDEDWAAGSQQIIQWTHEGEIYFVKLQYFDGTAWKSIVDRMENTGSHTWTVPPDAALPVLVKVSTFEGVTWNSNQPTAVGGAGEKGRQTDGISVFQRDGALIFNLQAGNAGVVTLKTFMGEEMESIHFRETQQVIRFSLSSNSFVPGVYIYSIAFEDGNRVGGKILLK